MSSPVLWYATRATGLVALVLLSATLVLGILTANRSSSPRWPGFALQDIHRRVSVIAMVFLAGHILTSVTDTYVHIGWTASWSPFVVIQTTVGGTGRRRCGPVAGGGRHQLATPQDACPDVAGGALARVRQLARGPRPCLRHGHRHGSALGDRPHRGVYRLRRGCRRMARGPGRPGADDSPSPSSRSTAARRVSPSSTSRT